MGDEVPYQGLTIFLLKQGIASYRDALKDPGPLTRYALKPSLPFKGALYLASEKRHEPSWLKFLRTGSSGDLGRLFNSSNSGVLFLKASKRRFALTFGYGQSLVKPEALERAFGIRVVLNTVDRNAIRSVDAKNVQELTIHTRRQASRGSPLEAFGLDTQADLLGAVTGEPRDKSLAKTVSGADALQMRTRVEFPGLGSKCTEALKASRAKDYRKQGFSFFDHVATVTDPETLRTLDGRLVERLASGVTDGIHLAPPTVVTWSNIDGFSFTKGAEAGEMLVAEFLSQIRKAEELTPDRLRRQHVFVHYRDSDEARSEWPVYRALVAEERVGQKRYVLSAGDWYEVATDFVRLVAGRLDRIPTASINLPLARKGEEEKLYNRRAAQVRGIHLADRKLLREGGSKIELCDLYTSQRQFVHVKRWDASSTLSHLFAQGIVSAETFISDDGFRLRARKLLAERAASLASHVPDGPPDRSRFEVVYAVIIDKKRGWKGSLPFFSQLNMARAAEQLRRLGLRVSACAINFE